MCLVLVLVLCKATLYANKPLNLCAYREQYSLPDKPKRGKTLLLRSHEYDQPLSR